MNLDDQIAALVVKLNKLTAFGEIQWRTEVPPRSILQGTDHYIPFYMTTDYKHQRFGLYLLRYQSYDGERDQFYWCEEVKFIILDLNDSITWGNIKWTSAMSDLYATAQRQVSNIDSIMGKLLSDE